MLKKLRNVLQDLFVKDKFASAGMFGTVLLVISAFVFASAQFLGIHEPVLDVALGIASFGGMITVAFGG
ncbi:MAG: hypothetical protein WCT48_02520, partial [Candidatus Paceibacterota bacterium]